MLLEHSIMLQGMVLCRIFRTALPQEDAHGFFRAYSVTSRISYFVTTTFRVTELPAASVAFNTKLLVPATTGMVFCQVFPVTVAAEPLTVTVTAEPVPSTGPDKTALVR